MLETLRLTFTANGKLQIFQGNFHTFSTEKLLIHVLILMQSTNCPKFEHQTVQVKIDLKFAESILRSLIFPAIYMYLRIKAM